MLSKYKKNLAAFTIVEMVVSVAIIALVTSLFLANYQGSVRRSNLSMATNILAADTRLAQSYSLGLVKYDTIFPDGGWGVAFDLSQPDRYYVFADGYSQAANYAMENDEVYPQFKGKTVILPADTRLSGISVQDSNGIWASSTKLAITFVPPKPSTMIHSISGSIFGQAANINLTNIAEGKTQTLSVNFVGLIDSQ